MNETEKEKSVLKKLPNTKESIMPGGSKLYASQFIEFFLVMKSNNWQGEEKSN